MIPQQYGCPKEDPDEDSTDKHTNVEGEVWQNSTLKRE